MLRGDDRAHRRAAADDALLAELLLEPSDTVLRPQPLSAEAAGGSWSATGSAGRGRRVRAACHRTTSGNPLLLRQLLRALEAEGVHAGRPSHADTVRAVGSRAVSSLVLLRLRRHARRLRPRSPGRWRCSGRTPTCPPIAALAQLPRKRRPRRCDLLSRSEILPDTRPLRFVHPLVRTRSTGDLSGGRARAAPRAGRPDPAGAGRAGGAGRRPPAAGPAPRRRGDRRGAAGGARGPRPTAARRTARSPTCGARCSEPPTGRDRPTCSSSSGRSRHWSTASAAVAHLREAYARLARPTRATAAPSSRCSIARTQVFAVAARAWRPRSRGGGRRAARRPRRRPAGSARARADRRLHARAAAADYRAGADPAGRGDGDGARMLAATLALRARCCDGSTGRRRRAGAVRAGRRPAARPSTTCCSGWSPSTCCWSRTPTSATLWRARPGAALATPPAACSPCWR